MKGLVEKDFFVLIKILKTYIFILVAYSVIGITSGQPDFFYNYADSYDGNDAINLFGI